MTGDRLHEKAEEALASERFSEVEGWSEEEAALDEKEDALNIWNELTHFRLLMVSALSSS